MTPDPLARVRDAIAAKRYMDENYLQVLREAAAQVGYAAVGRELGVTRQAAREKLLVKEEEE